MYHSFSPLCSSLLPCCSLFSLPFSLWFSLSSVFSVVPFVIFVPLCYPCSPLLSLFPFVILVPFSSLFSSPKPVYTSLTCDAKTAMKMWRALLFMNRFFTTTSTVKKVSRTEYPAKHSHKIHIKKSFDHILSPSINHFLQQYCVRVENNTCMHFLLLWPWTEFLCFRQKPGTCLQKQHSLNFACDNTAASVSQLCTIFILLNRIARTIYVTGILTWLQIFIMQFRDGKTRWRCGRVRAIFFLDCANLLAVYTQTS